MKTFISLESFSPGVETIIPCHIALLHRSTQCGLSEEDNTCQNRYGEETIHVKGNGGLDEIMRPVILNNTTEKMPLIATKSCLE